MKNISQEYTGAIAILLYSVLKGFGIELESGVLEGIITGVIALWIAIRRVNRGDITVAGVRKSQPILYKALLSVALIPSLFTSTTIYEKPPEPSIPELIIQYAEEYDVDPDIMLSIAYEESGFKNIDNSQYTEDYYSATGIFQIVKSTYKHFCGDDVEERRIPEKNIECAMKIASTSGIHHWSESFVINSREKRGWKYLRVNTRNYDEYSSQGITVPCELCLSQHR